MFSVALPPWLTILTPRCRFRVRLEFQTLLPDPIFQLILIIRVDHHGHRLFRHLHGFYGQGLEDITEIRLGGNLLQGKMDLLQQQLQDLPPGLGPGAGDGEVGCTGPFG